MLLPARGTRAFTLLELIVVIVILGILAAIAIPTFKQVIDRTHDEAARIEVSALQRQAWAAAAMDGTDAVYTTELFDGAHGTATAPGTYAGVEALALTEPEALGKAKGSRPSAKHGEVSLAIAPSNTTVRAAMRSRTGNCVFYSATQGTQTYNRVHKNVPDGACKAWYDGDTRPEAPTAPGGLPPVEGGGGSTWPPGTPDIGEGNPASPDTPPATSTETPTTSEPVFSAETCVTDTCPGPALDSSPTFSVATLAEAPGTASAVSMDVAGNRLWVAGSGGVKHVDLTTGAVTPWHTRAGEGSIFFRPSLYFLQDSSNIYRYDSTVGPSSEKVIISLIGTTAIAGDVVGAGSRLYVAQAVNGDRFLRRYTIDGAVAPEGGLVFDAGSWGPVIQSVDVDDTSIYVILSDGSLYKFPKDSNNLTTAGATRLATGLTTIGTKGNKIIHSGTNLFIPASNGNNFVRIDKVTGAKTLLAGVRSSGSGTGAWTAGFLNNVSGVTAYDDKVYLADSGNGRIGLLTPATLQARSFDLATVNVPGPAEVTTYAGNGGAYAGVPGTLASPIGAVHSVAASPDGNTLYMSLYDGKGVLASDVATGNVRWIPTAQPPMGMAAGGETLYYQHNCSVYAMNASTGSSAEMFSDTGTCDRESLATSSDGKRIFVGRFNQSGLEEILPDGTKAFVSGDTIRGISVDPTHVYYVNASAQLYRLPLAADARSWPSTPAPELVASLPSAPERSNSITRAGEYMYVIGTNEVSRVRIADGQVTYLAGTSADSFQDGVGREALFGTNLSGIAVAGGKLFVADRSNMRVRQLSAGAYPSDPLAATTVSTTAPATSSTYLGDGGAQDLTKTTVGTASPGPVSGIDRSPDGSKVFFGAGTKLAEVDVASGNITYREAGGEVFAVKSSEKMVYYLVNCAVKAMVRSTGAMVVLHSYSGTCDNHALTVSPDGKRVFMGHFSNGGLYEIMSNGSKRLVANGVITGLAADGQDVYAHSGNKVYKIDQNSVSVNLSDRTPLATVGTTAGGRSSLSLAGGSLHVVGDGHKVFRVDVATGTTTFLAGAGAGYAEGTGSAALFSSPRGTLGLGGKVYVADGANGRIRLLQ